MLRRPTVTLKLSARVRVQYIREKILHDHTIKRECLDHLSRDTHIGQDKNVPLWQNDKSEQRSFSRYIFREQAVGANHSNEHTRQRGREGGDTDFTGLQETYEGKRENRYGRITTCDVS